MSEGVTICATPTRIEQRAEKLSTLMCVIRGERDLRSTGQVVGNSVFLGAPHRWSVKRNASHAKAKSSLHCDRYHPQLLHVDLLFDGDHDHYRQTFD